MKTIIKAYLLFWSCVSLAQIKTYSLTQLLNMSQNSITYLDQESKFDSVEGQQALDQSQYDWQIYGKALIEQTDEQPLIQFQPPSDPYKEFELGIKKKTHYGIELSVSANNTSLVSGSTIESAKFGPKVAISIDLLSNILGRLDRAKAQQFFTQKQIFELNKKISLQNTKTQVKLIYWGIESLKEQKDILSKQIKLHLSLLNDLRKKKNDGFVESGDVLSAESQLQSLEAQRSILDYNITEQKKTLALLLPEISESLFLLQRSSLNSEAVATYNCVKKLKNQPPIELSYQAKLVDLAKEKFEKQKTQFSSLNSPKLKLMGALTSSHTDQTSDQAIGDYLDKRKQGYQLGLNLVIPLGGSSTLSKHKQISAAQKEWLTLKNQITSQISSTHFDLKQSLSILTSALEKQKKSSDFLEKSYLFKQRKYRQARADLTDLITEQNRVFMSQVNEIAISYDILKKFYSYQSIFQLFQCKG
jgi:outer membrane protein TolC